LPNDFSAAMTPRFTRIITNLAGKQRLLTVEKPPILLFSSQAEKDPKQASGGKWQ
jgi:hypothetical protein